MVTKLYRSAGDQLPSFNFAVRREVRRKRRAPIGGFIPDVLRNLLP